VVEAMLGSAQFAWIVVTHDRAFWRARLRGLWSCRGRTRAGRSRWRGTTRSFCGASRSFWRAGAAEQALANTVREDLRWLGRGAQGAADQEQGAVIASYERMMSWRT